MSTKHWIPCCIGPRTLPSMAVGRSLQCLLLVLLFFNYGGFIPERDAAAHVSVTSSRQGVSSPDVSTAHPLIQSSVGGAPKLHLSQAISREPLLGGGVTYGITVRNDGATPVVDRAYNLTVTNTLPIGLTYVSADPAPTLVSKAADGTTRITWDNVADLEPHESLGFNVIGNLSPTLTVADTFTNTVSAAMNAVPDNSGTWVRATSRLAARPQAIDVQVLAQPSTAVEQTSGAGEYPALGQRTGPDWPYHYRVTVANNNAGSTSAVVATVVLPPGVAYLGNPIITSNPNNSSAVPSLSLMSDGSLELRWNLGTLATAQYSTPVAITFDAAVSYRYRTSADTAAKAGPYAGPMHGAPIPDATLLATTYEATGTYKGTLSADGTQSTPADDSPATVTAGYLTANISAGPTVVGSGDTVSLNLAYAVAEYYAVSNVQLTAVLPDGLGYVAGSASRAPSQVQADTPGTGQTTISWLLPSSLVQPGASGTISLHAEVAGSYVAAPHTGFPIVSGDSFTSRVTINGNWQDLVASTRSGSVNSNGASATVATRMPAFQTEVWDATTNSWKHIGHGFTGDQMRFRVTYTGASDVDAQGIIVRDFLPRGMHYVEDSASSVHSGVLSDGPDCTSRPETPELGTLGGLQYLQWPLCHTAQGSSWQATFDAVIADLPQVQAGWTVADFGKLTGQNTYGVAFSLRDLATVSYVAPKLTLTKSASPSTSLVAGNTVNYTISVTNNGDAAAYNLVLVDTLPADLLVPNSGGSGSPRASTYSTISGNPATGAGGVVQWTSVGTLAVGATETYKYQATIPHGLRAGQQLTNLASVAYNSRADGEGHQTATTSNTADLNTKSMTVYIRGLTLTKTATPTRATIGDVVHWTINVSTPPSVIAYWPVLEENDLPAGFDYVVNSTQLHDTGGQIAFDTTLAHHSHNPLDSGDRDLRWFFTTIDNRDKGTTYTFSLSFDTLVTGVKGGSPNTTYYPNNCCLTTAHNDAYIGWYDVVSGYNHTGYAADTTDTSKIDRRSPKAGFDLAIQQPDVVLTASADHTLIGADDVVTFVLQASSLGNSEANEVAIADTLPVGLRFIATQDMRVTYPPGFPNLPVEMGDSNTAGSRVLNYTVDRLYVGAVWRVVFTAQVDASISAALNLANTAHSTYSSKQGTRPDSNSDGLPDERFYTGPNVLVNLSTPRATLAKSMDVDGELTFGSTVTYTLLLPATPINATVYDIAISDALDSHLTSIHVVNGTASGSVVHAAFTSIPPNEQQTIVITAVLPTTSSAHDGDVLRNQATWSSTNGGSQTSNTVSQMIVAPALMIDVEPSEPVVATGDVLSYTITISNTGGGRAAALQLQNTLPPTMHYIAGSGRIDGQPLADPVDGGWTLPDLEGHGTTTIVFSAHVAQADAGVAYVNSVHITGEDSRRQAIPSDNHARVPSDADPDDTAHARVYGPLTFRHLHSLVAYEDLKHTGWSDWDYNDFVVQIDIDQGLTPDDNLAVLKITYTALARGAGYDHQFNHHLPLEGTGRSILIVRSPAGKQVQRRGGVFAADPTLTVFDSTRSALPALPGLLQTNTLPSQTTYQPGASAELTVVLDDDTANPIDGIAAAPWDPYIFVRDTGQAVHLVGPGHLDNTQLVNGTYDRSTPLLGYDLPLAHIFDSTWVWPAEFYGIWQGYPDYVAYVESGGTQNPDWWSLANAVPRWLWMHRPGQTIGRTAPLAASGALSAIPGDAPTSRYFASPVIADLNGNGNQSIIIGNLLANRVEVYDASHRMLPGWPQQTGGSIKAAAVVADLDGDGSREIIVGASDGKLYAWHADGRPVAGWPIRVGVDLKHTFRILATPAVGDLDRDAHPDVVVPLADGRMYAFHANGTRLRGWPVSIGLVADSFGSQVINSSPRIADLDGDGKPEVVVGSADKQIYAFEGDGTLRWSFATGDIVMTSPAVADIDPAHPGLEVVAGSGDGYVYVLDQHGQRVWRRITGWTIRSSPLVADIDGDRKPEILIGGDDHKLWAWHRDGKIVAGWPQTTGAEVFSSPRLGDVDGDGKAEIVAGSDDGNVYAWHPDGRPASGWPRGATGAVKGAPAVANLDADNSTEVVAADLQGALYIWDVTSRVFVPLMRR